MGSDPPGRPEDGDADPDLDREAKHKDDADRDAILKRRRRFVAIALAGMTTGSAAAGCDALFSPCLEAPPAMPAPPPEPCLEPPVQVEGDDVPPSDELLTPEERQRILDQAASVGERPHVCLGISGRRLDDPVPTPTKMRDMPPGVPPHACLEPMPQVCLEFAPPSPDQELEQRRKPVGAGEEEEA